MTKSFTFQFSIFVPNTVLKYSAWAYNKSWYNMKIPPYGFIIVQVYNSITIICQLIPIAIFLVRSIMFGKKTVKERAIYRFHISSNSSWEKRRHYIFLIFPVKVSEIVSSPVKVGIIKINLKTNGKIRWNNLSKAISLEFHYLTKNQILYINAYMWNLEDVTDKSICRAGKEMKT